MATSNLQFKPRPQDTCEFVSIHDAILSRHHLTNRLLTDKML